MDISAILNTEKPKDNQIMNKVNFRSAVLDIKTRIADIPRDITNRINWIVRDTILANDYSGPTRAPKFSAEEQKQLIKVLAEELSGIGDSVSKAVKEYNENFGEFEEFNIDDIQRDIDNEFNASNAKLEEQSDTLDLNEIENTSNFEELWGKE